MMVGCGYNGVLSMGYSYVIGLYHDMRQCIHFQRLCKQSSMSVWEEEIHFLGVIHDVPVALLSELTIVP